MVVEGGCDLGHRRPHTPLLHADLHDVERQEPFAQQGRRSRGHGAGREVVAVEAAAGDAAVERPGNHVSGVEGDGAHVDISWVPSGLQHVDLPEQSIESHGPDDPYLTTASFASYLTRRA